MALPHSLNGLTPREAIQDAIYRAVTAFDYQDESLLRSAATPDIVFDLMGNRMEGIETVIKDSFNIVSKLDTTHFITNIRIDLDQNGEKAKATASALAQHYRPGTGFTPGADRLLAGSLYDMELIKDKDNLWKARVWKMKIVWAEGSMDVVQGK